jgi:CheY-like chemotaxis protein
MPRILVIDDEDSVRRSVALVLRTKGWDTELAGGGVQGLGMARRSPPDLILCDMNMPVMAGLQTLAEIRRDPLLKNIPVVMTTGGAGGEDEHEALRAGAQAVLLKPFRNEDLFALVGRCLPVSEEQGPAA